MGFRKSYIKTNLLTCFVQFCVILSSQNVTVFSNLSYLNSANLTECDCGWRNSNGLQIVGGNETRINEFPAMAAVINLESGTVYCGAHIISDQYVLTAAHCVYNKNVSTLALLVGEHNISTGGDTPYSALYYISDYAIYPLYDSSTYLNDIAILATTGQITFSTYVGPICLPFRYSQSDFAGETATILGWGQIEFSGPTSDVLLGANLNVISNTACELSQSETIYDQEICTFANGNQTIKLGFLGNEKITKLLGKDSCQSDSGGPVLWTDSTTNRMHLIGIISHGVGCDSGYPGINTRITWFLDWIISTTGATFCSM